ncbi:hypothetical protein, partial [Mesorhizobium sp. M7A.F.Ca.CA.003.01.2.1]|uniref:hypothetical protein n=1 Tax=Mesorhizobium sp. M7A.F.Ca.CA.003.01.2.1 TaxID=2496722 RepID=UPI0019D1B2F2
MRPYLNAPNPASLYGNMIDETEIRGWKTARILPRRLRVQRARHALMACRKQLLPLLRERLIPHT